LATSATHPKLVVAQLAVQMDNGGIDAAELAWTPAVLPGFSSRSFLWQAGKDNLAMCWLPVTLRIVVYMLHRHTHKVPNT
jgi:hypothetical protein